MKNTKQIKNIFLLLTLFALLSCANAVYEMWDGLPSVEVAGSKLSEYIISENSYAVATDGREIEFKEFETGKLSTKKGAGGIWYVDDQDILYIESKSSMKVHFEDDIGEELYHISDNTHIKIYLYDIITKCGYDDFGDVIAVINFGKDENGNEVSYKVVV